MVSQIEKYYFQFYSCVGLINKEFRGHTQAEIRDGLGQSYEYGKVGIKRPVPAFPNIQQKVIQNLIILNTGLGALKI